MNDKNIDMLAFPDADSFKNIVAETLKMAQANGASQAEAGLSVSQGLSVAARMRSVETIEHQQDNGLVSAFISANIKAAPVLPISIRRQSERRLKRPVISPNIPPKTPAQVLLMGN